MPTTIAVFWREKTVQSPFSIIVGSSRGTAEHSSKPSEDYDQCGSNPNEQVIAQLSEESMPLFIGK